MSKIEEQRVAKEKLLTQERLKELLDYDAETGVFRFKFGRMAKKLDPTHLDGKGYKKVYIKPTNFLAHRLAWLYVYGVWPGPVMDHINRDRADNRIANLREATVSENAINIGMLKSNKTGVRGVCWGAAAQAYLVSFRLNGKKHNLGRFKTIEEAAAVAATIPERRKALSLTQAPSITT